MAIEQLPPTQTGTNQPKDKVETVKKKSIWQRLRERKAKNIKRDLEFGKAGVSLKPGAILPGSDKFPSEPLDPTGGYAHGR